ncbi:MAG TPA: DNA mismatch repair protein MutS [bacterium]|nr:DNA mismatch repair protein MutS [bacterium]
MMRQYHQLKARYAGALLMFRLGDFYELFYEDAQVASRELDIVLTSREVGKGRRVPMCGVPHHALDPYLARLVERGYRIAICDQLEDPRKAKGLVKRDVVRVVTPGTVIEQPLLPQHTNNFLIAVAAGEGHWGVAAADLSTGEFQVTELAGEGTTARLAEELARFGPREVLAAEADAETVRGILGDGVHLTALEDWKFDEAAARRRLHEHLRVVSLDAFGCAHLPRAVSAAGALLQYLKDTQFSPLAHIRRITTYSTDAGLLLDASTRRNLEIVRNQRDGGLHGTLLWVLDETKTSMGARRLRQWLLLPLIDREMIEARLDAVEELVRAPRRRTALAAALTGLADLERLMGRVGHGSANGRDLVALAASLRKLPALREALDGGQTRALQDVAGRIADHAGIATLIEAAIVDHPPVTVQEGGIIRDDYDADLAVLRASTREGKAWIAQLEADERTRTGIKSLRVGFNKVFGYYIEVSKSNLHLVPPDYLRKQTLTGAERFITEAMKEREAIILGAEERMASLEYELFSRVRDEVASAADAVLGTARAVAELDALLSLAEVAATGRYVRPEITSDPSLEIRAGRHAVVERVLTDERFVPNDVSLDAHRRAVLIVTGPNMAGKSTYLRQCALIALLAHIGSFVPAESARIGLVDRIFTRVGAVDDIATGRSTFLVEMQEVGNILHHATRRSLIILDEVGRGTSTYDGMSIAWAVVEYLHDHVGARTLFATHYHELTELGALLPRVHNVNVLVKEEGDRVVFLRKVADGGADRSYGIHVAQLAGLPPAVIEHAQRILRHLEAAPQVPGGEEPFLPPVPARATGALQLPLPLQPVSPVEGALMELSLEAMTPLEAMQALHALREQVRQRLASLHATPHGGKVVRMKRHGPKQP